jgi:hypothetical protein
MRLGVTLCTAAVIACLFAITSRSWWTYNEQDTEIEIGLWSSKLSVGEHSTRYMIRGALASERTLETHELVGGLDPQKESFVIDPDWYARPHSSHSYVVALGRLTWVFGLATLVSAAVLGGFALRGRKPASLAMATGSCAVGLAVCTLVFVIAVPAGIHQLPMNLGVPFALGGAACALLAAISDDAAHVAAVNRRSLIVGLAGVVALFVALETRTWWREVDDRNHYSATYDLRSAMKCETDDGKTTCLERSSRMASESVFPHDSTRANRRAAEIAFVVGHLLLFAGVIASILRAVGRRLPGAGRATVALVLVFAVPVLRAVTTRPDHDAALSSFGPLFALAGVILFLVAVRIDAPRRARSP